MFQFFSGLDPTLVLCLFVPAAMIFAAWSLQIACAIASVDPPDFWQSLLCTFLVVVANIVLRFWVNTSVSAPGLGTSLLAPIVLTIAIVAILVRTGPLSALVVTTCQGLIFTALYLGLSMLNSTIANTI